MKTFIDFIVDLTADSSLGEAFVTELEKASTVAELKNFFKEKGYEITEAECVRLIENKDKLSGENVKGAY